MYSTALAVAWEAQAALDLIIFVLTAWKSFQMLRGRRQDDWHFGNITDVIVRDGAYTLSRAQAVDSCSEQVQYTSGMALNLQYPSHLDAFL